MNDDHITDNEMITWRKFATKPLVVEAVQIGIDVKKDSFEGEVPLQDGDFLIRNPEAGKEGQPDVYYRSKEEFNELYGEIQ